MPQQARNKLIIEGLHQQDQTSTGCRMFGRGETVFLAVVTNADRPTEQLGKIIDFDGLTGARYVSRYDDCGDSYFDRDLHKLILIDGPVVTQPTPDVRIRPYVHEIRLWDSDRQVLGAAQGHVITERFEQFDKGTPKFPPDYYVVEIVYRGRTCYRLNRGV
jgi:hypothetical protein